MIPGSVEKKIKKYFLIDRCAEGFGYISANNGETLIGIPYGWYHENSTPFIEHRVDGVVTKTVNVSDVSEIVFEI